MTKSFLIESNHRAFSPDQRLTITLRYLATGDQIRIYRKSINMHPKYDDNIVISTICLHNFIKSEKDHAEVNNRIYYPPNFVDSEDTTSNTV
ncbi:hypothetical protein ALC53_12374 [Atta colombica]|uniref:DDE Tnp4 domain-containing protein n=1 Tax=Atta colombica TaxID=520822 RepID=A0A151HZ95_9HYME|nr:hypothetical protein ALC53_12374 [Atta colombica]